MKVPNGADTRANTAHDGHRQRFNSGSGIDRSDATYERAERERWLREEAAMRLDMILSFTTVATRRKAVPSVSCTIAVALLILLGSVSRSMAAGQSASYGSNGSSASNSSDGSYGSDGSDEQSGKYGLDDELTRRSRDEDPQEKTRVIVRLVGSATLPAEFKRFIKGETLDIINGLVLELPNKLLTRLAALPNVFCVHYDRPIVSQNYRTSVTVGARTVQQTLGYTGASVGVAVIDSGIATWHDDLTVGSSTTVYPYGNQRVSKFLDFVNGRALPYDDNGHGSHVAGTILGNGYDSNGNNAGMAPAASLVSLKVLDADGQGTISNIIAALNWVAANYRAYNIRVVNLSVGAYVHQSYWLDPLTLAAKAVVDKGIVVVAAAGNFGKNADGQPQYGGITAPGNAPWVLTVGASSTMGTLTRADDTMAGYSSSGPTYIDYAAKPDLVAPGTGTVSLAVPGSTLYATNAAYLLKGSIPLGAMPYLSLSGTSMSAPVVSGTVALMLQANPNLTPNLVKAILQYTAQVYPGYNALQQGAGFLNTLGAVRLATFYAAAQPGDSIPVEKVWSRRIIWGTHLLTGGVLAPTANAWATNIVWGTARVPGTGDNIVWGTAGRDNIVWGTAGRDNIVWGTAGKGDNIVWGTGGGHDNIVWGTACGGSDCRNIVWGTFDPVRNIVWGTANKGDNIVWGTRGYDNIVWGTAGYNNIVWGTGQVDQIMWDTPAFPSSSDDDENRHQQASGGPSERWGSPFEPSPIRSLPPVTMRLLRGEA
jgi:serine protease AprX